MLPLQTFLVWAALSGAVFSLPANAQEEVTKGNQANPHQPPAWFARLATPEKPQYIDPESISFNLPEVSSSMGRPAVTGQKYACKKPNGTWLLCH